MNDSSDLLGLPPVVLPGKNIRVVDPFTIKPLDAATILSAARATGGRIITVEDHYKEGQSLYPPRPPSPPP